MPRQDCHQLSPPIMWIRVKKNIEQGGSAHQTQVEPVGKESIIRPVYLRVYTRKGNLRSVLSILAVRAWAAMWWTGNIGRLCFMHKYLGYVHFILQSWALHLLCIIGPHNERSFKSWPIGHCNGRQMLESHFCFFQSQCHNSLDFLRVPGHGKSGYNTAIPIIRSQFSPMNIHNSRYLADSWVERASPRTSPCKLITQAPVSSQDVSMPKIRDREAMGKAAFGRSFLHPPLMLPVKEPKCLSWRLCAVKNEKGENLGQMNSLLPAIGIIAIFFLVL